MRSRPLLSSCSLLAIALLGCGSGINKSAQIADAPVVPAPPGSFTSTLYHAYGDSITYGYNLSSVTLAYPYLISADESLTLKDYGLSGDQACDVPAWQIFPHGDDPGTPYPLYTLMIGTNDADNKGSGAYEAVYNLCHQATLSWLALPATSKVLATNSTVTSSGPGALDPAAYWNAWHTTVAGASVTFPISLASSAPLYLWPRIIDGDAGAFTYALDGTTVGSFQTATSPSISTAFGGFSSMALIRIPGVAAGTHTITFTQTSAFGSMQIVGIGSPGASSTPGFSQLPIVIVGDIPLQLQNSTAPCTVNPAPCNAYNQDIQANVALFQGDGLRVRYAENHTYMRGTAAEMDDMLHPNPLGQSHLREAFEALLSQ